MAEKLLDLTYPITSMFTGESMLPTPMVNWWTSAQHEQTHTHARTHARTHTHAHTHTQAHTHKLLIACMTLMMCRTSFQY